MITMQCTLFYHICFCFLTFGNWVMNFHVISHLISRQEALLGGWCACRSKFYEANLESPEARYSHCVIWHVGVQQHLT